MGAFTKKMRKKAGLNKPNYDKKHIQSLIRDKKFQEYIKLMTNKELTNLDKYRSKLNKMLKKAHAKFQNENITINKTSFSNVLSDK